MKDQEEFLTRVGDMYHNGYSLTEAIELISIHYSAKKKQHVFSAMKALRSGDSIHQVLEGLHFHEDVLSLLFFSQKHGNLAHAFCSAGEMLGRKRQYREKLVSLIRYPMLLLILVFIMLLFVHVILVPQFLQLFHHMNLEMDALLSTFFTLLNYAPVLPLFFFGATLFLLASYHMFYKKMKPTKRIQLLFKFPLIRTYLSLHYSHYFAEQLSNLLSSGLTINEALSVFERQNYHPYFQTKASEFRSRLIEGEKLEDLVGKEIVFVKGLELIIMHGQNNGRLPLELLQYSRILLGRLEEHVEKLLAKIQPLLLLGVGAFVMILYLSIFIPMFQLMGGI